MNTSGIPVDASAEELARLAAERADLWSEIEAHPNAYPGLREWIAGQRATDAGEGPGEAAGSLTRAKHRRRGPVLAAVIAGALVLGGGTAALAAGGVLGSWFGGSQQEGAESTHAFAQPPEQTWSVGASELIETPDSGAEPAFVSGRVAFADAIALPFSDGSAGYGFALVGAEDGALRWSEHTGVSPNGGLARCGAGPTTEIAVCVQSFAPQSEIFVLDADGVRSRAKVDGWVDAVNADSRGVTIAVGASDWGVEKSYLSRIDLEGEEQRLLTGWLDAAASETGDTGYGCDAMVGETFVLAYGDRCHDEHSIDGRAYRVVSEHPVSESDLVYVPTPDGSGAFWLLDDGEELRAFDEANGKQLWTMPRADALLPETQVDAEEATRSWLTGSMRFPSEPAATLLPTGVLIDDAGEVVADFAEQSGLNGGQWTLANEAAVGLDGESGSVVAFDPVSSEKLWERTLEPAHWIAGAATGFALGAPRETDAGGRTLSGGLSYYEPGTGASAKGAVTKAGAVPDFIPAECPEATVPLAWAELADGWLLVCGKPMGKGADRHEAEPVFMQISFGGSEKPYTLTEVKWSAELGQFSGKMPDGTRIVVDGEAGTVAHLDASENSTRELLRIVRILIVPLWGEETVRGFADGTAKRWTAEAAALAPGGSGASFPVAADRRLDESWADAAAPIDGAIAVEVHTDAGQEALLLSAANGEVLWRDGVSGGERNYSTVQCVPDPAAELAYCLLTDQRSSEIVVLDGEGEVRRFPVAHPVASIAVDERGIAGVGYDAEGTLLRMDLSGAVLWDSEPIVRATGVITGIDFVGDRVLVRSTGGWELLDDRSGARLTGFAYPQPRTLDAPEAPCEARLLEASLQVAGGACPDGLTANRLRVEHRPVTEGRRWYIDLGFKNWRGPDGYLEQAPAGDRVTFYGNAG